MTYMRGMDNEMHRVPERDLNPPDDKPEFTDDERTTARDEMIEIILSFGQWPQPRPRGSLLRQVEKEFDLYDFLHDRVCECMTEEAINKDTGKGTMLEVCDLLEFLIAALSDHGICGQFASKRDAWEKKVTLWLIAFFDDTDRGRQMVEEHAADIERAEREDH